MHALNTAVSLSPSHVAGHFTQLYLKHRAPDLASTNHFLYRHYCLPSSGLNSPASRVKVVYRFEQTVKQCRDFVSVKRAHRRVRSTRAVSLSRSRAARYRVSRDVYATQHCARVHVCRHRCAYFQVSAIRTRRLRDPLRTPRCVHDAISALRHVVKSGSVSVRRNSVKVAADVLRICAVKLCVAQSRYTACVLQLVRASVTISTWR